MGRWRHVLVGVALLVSGEFAAAQQSPMQGGAGEDPEIVFGHSTLTQGLSTLQDLPPLEHELNLYGGSSLYAPEGDRGGWVESSTPDTQHLRLPQNWLAPEPLTGQAEFLGADPVVQYPGGPSGYSPDPRFVGSGSYSVFGLGFDQGNQRRAAIGHQLILDFDLQLTGTERFHVQWRPVGERMSGGSYYQWTSPAGYVDNSTLEPDRYWFEGELHSLLGWQQDPLAAWYVNFVGGKFPFALHNNLLMNDEIIGMVVSGNNIPCGDLSNLNLQLFTGLNDVDTYAGVESQLVGLHATVDYRKQFYELTWALVNSHGPRDTQYVAASGTQFLGLLSLAGRALFKLGDPISSGSRGGTGDSQLFVVESNYTRGLQPNPFGIEQAVMFTNAFWAGSGWNSIAGTNFSRLRTAFEVNPLIRLSTIGGAQKTFGVATGVQLFRHHEDESLIPEFAWEQPGGQSVYGVGLRYLRKTGPQTFLEVLGVINRSSDDRYDRTGIFLAHTLAF
ncbi:MAG: hypothetical protein R3C49_07520 [Planctomycetaceae bacterium]